MIKRYTYISTKRKFLSQPIIMGAKSANVRSVLWNCREEREKERINRQTAFFWSKCNVNTRMKNMVWECVVDDGRKLVNGQRMRVMCTLNHPFFQSVEVFYEACCSAILFTFVCLSLSLVPSSVCAYVIISIAINQFVCEWS